jgi:hypothetical protein
MRPPEWTPRGFAPLQYSTGGGGGGGGGGGSVHWAASVGETAGLETPARGGGADGQLAASAGCAFCFLSLAVSLHSQTFLSLFSCSL